MEKPARKRHNSLLSPCTCWEEKKMLWICPWNEIFRITLRRLFTVQASNRSAMRFRLHDRECKRHFSHNLLLPLSSDLLSISVDLKSLETDFNNTPTKINSPWGEIETYYVLNKEKFNKEEKFSFKKWQSFPERVKIGAGSFCQLVISSI
jgi:hypothetical protein